MNLITEKNDLSHRQDTPDVSQEGNEFADHSLPCHQVV